MATEIQEYLDEKGRSPFGAWFDDLPATAAAKVAVAIDRIGRGLLGDVESVGCRFSERRIDFGPGYRIYFGSIKGGQAINLAIFLDGGIKKRQCEYIAIARSRWKDCKTRRRKGEE